MTDALDPTLDDLLRVASKRYSKEQSYTDIPGKVLAYNAATQTADVQPLVLVPRNEQLRPVGILRDVQVRWPAGSTWSIVGELTAGDFGWLRFAGADISAWKMQGTELDPTAIPRSGSVSDAIFEPGSQPVSVPLAADAYAAGALVVKAASLLLGDSTATDYVALAAKTLSELENITDWATGHVHTGVLTGGGSTGAPATPPTAPASVAATKVKAK